MGIKYPKGETVWVSYCNLQKETVCLLICKPSRNFYYLYEVLSSGELKKLGKARSPTELEEKFDVKARMSR